MQGGLLAARPAQLAQLGVHTACADYVMCAKEVVRTACSLRSNQAINETLDAWPSSATLDPGMAPDFSPSFWPRLHITVMPATRELPLPGTQPCISGQP